MDLVFRAADSAADAGNSNDDNPFANRELNHVSVKEKRSFGDVGQHDLRSRLEMAGVINSVSLLDLLGIVVYLLSRRVFSTIFLRHRLECRPGSHDMGVHAVPLVAFDPATPRHVC